MLSSPVMVQAIRSWLPGNSGRATWVRACWTGADWLVILTLVERILAEALGQDATPTAIAEKRDLLQRLMARLAHEIRNPLSSLGVHVQLLEEDLGNLAPATLEPLSGRLEIIRGELHRLETVVDRFLRVAGPSTLDVETIELVKLVNHVCELLRPEAAAREIEIVTETKPLPSLRADPVRVTQALMNLVINAMQAVERKGRISVATAAADHAQMVTVRDTGPGIPPEKLSTIFDPYFTTKAEGSGLGLWIAQQIVTAHGGTIKAQNAPEGGALFIMVLPVKSESISG